METIKKYPLSLSQRNIWDIERICPDTPINQIGTTLRIRGRVDLSLLQKSINLVLEADGSLRTHITLQDGEPVQYQAAFAEEQIPVYDFSQTSRESLEEWEIAATREPMRLLDAPLYRFMLLRTGENAGALLVKTHHLISDGWTQVLLCNRIGQAYLDLLAGEEPQLEQAPSYLRHVEEEQAYLDSPACRRDEEYWRRTLEQMGEPAVLKSVRGAEVSPVGRRISFSLPEELNNAIYTFCKRHRVAPFSVFYMALATYFKRTGGSGRFTIGVPIFNRSNFAAKQTSGMFVSTLPFCCQVSEVWSLDQFNERLGEQWFELLRHQRFPFSRIQSMAGQSAGERLFHIAFSYQNGELLSSRDASVSFSGRWHYSGYQMEQLCIHLSNLEDNRRYSVDYDYLIQVFSQREIETLHTCLLNILRDALAMPDKPLCRLEMLSAAEREQVLYRFNRTAQPLFERGLYQRFERIVREHGARAALICGETRVSYVEVERAAMRFHAAVAEHCVQPDALIAVMLPRSVPLFQAMMGILRAGGAFLLLDPDLPENRVREILVRSGAAALVTTPELGGGLNGLLPMVDPAELPRADERGTVYREGETLAYMVYTSGSTGMPKGVEISRRSLLNLACGMEDLYADGAVLSVCGVGFDAFLLESAAALLNGRTIVLPSQAELESPRQLARLIVGYGVGFLSLTPSRLTAFLKEPEFRRAMARVERIVCGGEGFPSELLQRLHGVTKARIYNQYGPSEAAVAASVKQLNGSGVITAGVPMLNCKLYVLDEWMNPMPIGVFGELYIGGLGVGRGYRGEPELTARSFMDNPFELGGRLYRTGDMACWTPEGEIILAGRQDRQVKLRGLRVEPQEVAACLARHPGVRESTASVQEQNGQTLLVGFYTSDAPIPEEELTALAAAYLPHYMIPAAVIRLERIPLTANGKVDEARLPVPDLFAGGEARPQTALEETLLEVFRQVLRRDDIGAESDYFLCGGNSLNAMETLGEIGERTGRTLLIAELYASRTARRLARRLEGTAADRRSAEHLEPAPPQARWPLTPIQQGIYVQSHMDPTGRTYHMAGAFRLPQGVEHARLERAFRHLIAEEPLLRTAFFQEPDGIFARVTEQADFVLPIAVGADLAQASGELLRPFRLDQAPLLRAALWEERPGQWLLLMNTHHIIGDGLTTPVLLDRLDRLYQGLETEQNGLSYLDYAWQLARGEHSAPDYWVRRLSPLPEPLDLPGDFPRTRTPDYQGGVRTLALTPELSDLCDACCQSWGVSAYAFFLGAFGVLLSRLSGKENLIVGAPAAGRLMPETRQMCGPFLNTLPLRLRPAADRTVRAYLEEVREEINGMLDHQQTGLEEIAAALKLPRTLSQSPLFQVIVSQRPLDAGAFTLDGAPLEYIPIPTGTAKMELSLELAREGDHYAFVLEYASRLFLEETADYYGRCFREIVRAMTAPGAETLGGLNALSPRDRMELLELPQNMVTPFLNLPYPVLFARQLALDPDAPAVIFHGTVTTRAQLDRRANQMANLLRQAGAAPGSQIGIAMSRSADLVAAVLGIWKAGCAYVPLLAHYPAERLRYMAEIAEISHILCDRAALERLPGDLPCVLVPTDGQAADQFDAAPLKPTDLAEVLFTSGSTGRPKGVMLAWRSVANMLAGFRLILEKVDGPILCTTNVVFDMFNGEVTMPLAIGKTIVMADDEEMMLPWKLAELIQRDGVKLTQSTPSRVQMWLSNESFCQAARGLGMMIYGGEVLTEALLRKAQEAAPNAIMTNMYGPTEGTVYNTTRTADWRQYVNIGKPMVNNRLYILDESGRQVLPTACGDLYLAGECVTQGYINRPDLTQAAFRPDPFFPGERMYRTGDIARLRLDGTYDFLGRRDAQVKLNGQRVELSEINETMVVSGCALQAATVPLRREDGSMSLYTYYIPAPDGPRDEHEIRARMGKTLPAYMIPASLTAMEKLPATPTGKIDLRALGQIARGEQPEIIPAAPEAGKAEHPAALAQHPTAETQVRTETADTPAGEPDNAPVEADIPAEGVEWILSVWRQVLGGEQLDPDRSFFEQGGTSLAALSVLSHYHNRKREMSLAQFYERPTARAQAALLAGGAPVSKAEKATPAAPERPVSLPAHPKAAPEPAQAILIRGTEYPRYVPKLPRERGGRRSLGTVLLTGATGFLGVHMLSALLDAGADRVICLVREGGETRLTETLSWYFGSGWTAGCAPQLETMTGDITRPGLGLSPEAYQRLSGSLNSVWHCAADVRHYAADEQAYLATNLEGTEQLIKLARAACVPLYHMSTESVAGQRLRAGEDGAEFTEEDFDLGQDWQTNLYVKSKFQAEHAVFEAARAGLTARVFRLGRLVGRASDGTFQRNPRTNAFWLTLRGIHALGAIPASMAETPVEMTPIDWCARAIVALRSAPLAAYHIHNPAPCTLAAAAAAVTPDLKILPDAEFEALVASVPVDRSGDVLAPLLDLWQGSKTRPVTIRVTNAKTMEQMERCGFHEEIPGPERLLRAFRFDASERVEKREG